MPELPEVETIARTLAPQVEGRRIVACELLNPSTFEGTIPLGKVVGGGMPLAAVAGRADVMDLLAPLGPVYQAVAVASCIRIGSAASCGRGLSVRFAGPVPCLRG